MIQKINLLQNAIHHKKVAMLEGIDPQGDGFYVVKMLLEDFNTKLSEVIDHVNATEGSGFQDEVLAKKKEVETISRLMGSETRSRADVDVLEHFMAPGESCVSVSATNVLSASEELLGYDIVMVKRVDYETANFMMVADRAIELAKKRAIIGVHTSLLEQWNLYMARVPYHWEQYELEGNPEEVDYFIIDKLEGQQTLAEQT